MGMFYLQFFYSQKNLFDLISFGLPLVILNVYPRIALPRCFIYAMTAAPLPRRAKIAIAYLTQIIESYVPRILPHMDKQAFQIAYDSIVSLLVSLSRTICGGVKQLERVKQGAATKRLSCFWHIHDS
jgi:hypothetical protein